MGLELRRYGLGINAGAAVGRPHSHCRRVELGPRDISLKWSHDTDTSYGLESLSLIGRW